MDPTGQLRRNPGGVLGRGGWAAEGAPGPGRSGGGRGPGQLASHAHGGDEPPDRPPDGDPSGELQGEPAARR